ncbi:hypothetical protein HGP14_02965 [Rhizobium sp. P32RR-XVIII]|nr:hypothetical protein [Rhizobium sp. P32RR-XVIII]
MKGSAVPAAAIEGPQREIVDVIEQSGFVPSDDMQLARAIQSQRMNYAVAGGTANALTTVLTPATEALTVGMVLRLLVTTENTGPVTLNAGVGALAVVTASGAPLARRDLVVGDIATLIYDGASWRMASMVRSEVLRNIGANVTLYVRPDGSDSNDGSSNTPEAAFATPQGAVDYVNLTFAANSFTVTINVTAGTYPGLLIRRSPMRLIIQRNGAGTARISGAALAGGAAVNVQGNAEVVFKDISIRALNANTYGLVVDNAFVTLDGCNLDDAPLYNIVAGTGASILLVGLISITGGNRAGVMRGQTGGLIESSTVTPPTMRIDNVITLSGSFVSAQTGGVVSVPSISYLGNSNIIGPRYSAILNGVISTNGAGANFFPGSVAGSVATGGQYV